MKLSNRPQKLHQALEAEAHIMRTQCVPEVKVINATTDGPDDLADELAAGRLTPEQLKAKADDYVANHQSLPALLKAVLELARAGELDHRAGQIKSAEARATVAIAVADAISHSLSAKHQAGWLGKLLATDDRLSTLALKATSQSHLTLGGLARDRGNLALAESEYRTALESARTIRGDELATGVAMLELGHNCHLQGRDQEAEEWLRQAHPLLVQAQGAAYVPLDTYLLGLTQIGMQRWDEALSTLQETESLFAQRNLSKGVLDSRLARTDILIRTGRISDAEQLARDTDEMAKQLNETQYMAQARWHLSRIKRAEQKPEEAIGLLDEAIKLNEQAGDSWHRAQGLMVLAEVQRQVGRVDQADRSLDEADRIATQMNSPFLEADCKRARANLRSATGKLSDARRLLTEAMGMYADQGRVDRVRLAKAQLENLPS